MQLRLDPSLLNSCILSMVTSCFPLVPDSETPLPFESIFTRCFLSDPSRIAVSSALARISQIDLLHNMK